MFIICAIFQDPAINFSNWVCLVGQFNTPRIVAGTVPGLDREEVFLTAILDAVVAVESMAGSKHPIRILVSDADIAKRLQKANTVTTAMSGHRELWHKLLEIKRRHDLTFIAAFDKDSTFSPFWLGWQLAGPHTFGF